MVSFQIAFLNNTFFPSDNMTFHENDEIALHKFSKEWPNRHHWSSC